MLLKRDKEKDREMETNHATHGSREGRADLVTLDLATNERTSDDLASRH